MYDTQFVAKRIKERAKKCGIKTGDMLTDLGLGVNSGRPRLHKVIYMSGWLFVAA